MTTLSTQRMLDELLARRPVGHTLEAPFYLSESIFEADVEQVFSKHWIFVAVEPEIPEAGDYITVEFATKSILIVRDDDGSVQAFHNVCRHRGSRLCPSQKGMVGNIVCPYHQWTYDLKGTLIHAEHMGDSFDRSQHGLKTVHVKTLSGLIYICLAATPPDDFDAMVERMKPYLDPHGLATQSKVAKQVDIIEHGNWKLTMENNRECYHCRANHPELTISLYEYGFGYQPSEANAKGLRKFEETMARDHARWEAQGLPSGEIDVLDNAVTGYRTQRLSLDRSGQSQTMNAEVACKKLLGNLKDPALGGLSFWTQPNSWHHFMSDHIITFSVLPLAANRTLLRTTWCVHKDAVEGVDYDVDNLTKVWEATNKQDSRLVEESYRGVSTGAYEPGPYSPYTEELVEKFTHWYVQRMRATAT